MTVKRTSSYNSNTNQKSVKKNIRFEHSLVRDIESICPDGVTFSSWVKAACRERCIVEKVIAHSQNPPSIICITLVQKLRTRGSSPSQIAWKLNCVGICTAQGKKWSQADVEVILETLG